MLDTVFFLIADQKVAEAALLERRKVVLLTPDAVDFVKLLGADSAVFCQADVSFGLHKQKRIVGVLLDDIPVCTCAFAFRKTEAVGNQPPQSFECPEEDSFQLAAHLFR